MNQATEVGVTEGAPGIQRAIAALENDQLRGMIFVLISSRVGDVERVRDAIRDQFARMHFDQLETRVSVTLN